MNLKEFEEHLRQSGDFSDHEIRELLSRASWVETTLNISLDDLVVEEASMVAFRERLLEAIGHEEKTDDFYRALWAYYEFQNRKKE